MQHGDTDESLSVENDTLSENGDEQETTPKYAGDLEELLQEAAFNLVIKNENDCYDRLKFFISGEVSPDPELVKTGIENKNKLLILQSKLNLLKVFETILQNPNQACNAPSLKWSDAQILTLIQDIAQKIQQALQNDTHFNLDPQTNLSNDFLNSQLDFIRTDVRLDLFLNQLVPQEKEETVASLRKQWLSELAKIFNFLNSHQSKITLKDVTSKSTEVQTEWDEAMQVVGSFEQQLTASVKARSAQIVNGLTELTTSLTPTQVTKKEFAKQNKSAAKLTLETNSTSSSDSHSEQSSPQSSESKDIDSPPPSPDATVRKRKSIINTPSKAKLAHTKIKVNAQDRSGRTLLHYAVINEDLPIFHLLLSAGARLDIRDLNGQTPLDIRKKIGKRSNQSPGAAYIVEEETTENHQTRVRKLLASQDDATGNTAMHWAVCNGHQRSFHLCYTFGSKLETKNKKGKTPLDITDKNGNTLYHLTVNKIEPDDDKNFNYPDFVKQVIQFAKQKTMSQDDHPAAEEDNTTNTRRRIKFHDRTRRQLTYEVEAKKTSSPPAALDESVFLNNSPDLNIDISLTPEDKTTSSEIFQEHDQEHLAQRARQTFLKTNIHNHQPGQTPLLKASQLLHEQYKELARLQGRQPHIERQFWQLKRYLFNKLNNRFISSKSKKILTDKLRLIEEAEAQLMLGEEQFTNVKRKLQGSNIISHCRSLFSSKTLNLVNTLDLKLPPIEKMKTCKISTGSRIKIIPGQLPVEPLTLDNNNKTDLHYMIERGDHCGIQAWSNTIMKGYDPQQAAKIFDRDSNNRTPIELAIQKAYDIKQDIEKEKNKIRIQHNKHFSLIIAHLMDELLCCRKTSKDYLILSRKFELLQNKQAEIARGKDLLKALEELNSHPDIQKPCNWWTKKGNTKTNKLLSEEIIAEKAERKAAESYLEARRATM